MRPLAAAGASETRASRPPRRKGQAREPARQLLFFPFTGVRRGGRPDRQTPVQVPQWKGALDERRHPQRQDPVLAAHGSNAFHGVERRAGTRTAPRCEAGQGGVKLNASSGAFVCSDFVILRVLGRETFVTRKNCKLYESIGFPHSAAASNSNFERGFEAHSWRRSLNLHVLRVPPLLSPCSRRIISALWQIISLFRGRRPFLLNPLLSIGFSRINRSGDRSFSLFSAWLSGSIRENQSAKPVSDPGLIPPSTLPQQARMEPRRLEM